MCRTAWAVGVVLSLLVLQGAAQQTPPTPSSDAGQPPETQQQPPNNQIPVFRGGTNLVRVDVIATTSDGQPVMDLTIDDFELTEDDDTQKIETFKLIEVSTGLVPGPEGPPRAIRTDADEAREAARDDVRLIAFFLDDYHVRESPSLTARLEFVKFVETQLVPSDMVTLMYPLEPISTVRFTRNHGAIAQGLRNFVGRKYNYEPKNAIEQGYVYRMSTQSVEMIRNDVSMGAMKSLIVHMGGLKEGRKSLVLISEGYTNIVPPQLQSDIAGTTDPNNAARFDPGAGISTTDQRMNFMQNVDMDLRLRELYDLANQNNVSIYAVDPRGLAASEFGADQVSINVQADWATLRNTQETLRTLALSTDGAAIINRNDLAVAMRPIVQDANAYYLLGYSGAAEADGKFHRIRVRVKRPGVNIRYREGYWAPTNDTAVRTSATLKPRPGPPPDIEAAFKTLATATARQRVVRAWVSTTRGDNGRTRVTVFWEPAQPAAPGARNRPASMMVTATGSDGAPYFRGRLASVTTATTAAAAAQTGGRASFDAPPGPLQLRLAVEDADNEVIDSEMREVSVPDLTAPETMLATPEVYRARTAREVQQIKSDPQVMPTASREFRRAEQVLIKLTAYGAGTERPSLTARLLNRDGKPVIDIPIADVNGTPFLELALAPMAPGEYVIEIVAGPDDRPARELIGIRVIG